MSGSKKNTNRPNKKTTSQPIQNTVSQDMFASLYNDFPQQQFPQQNFPQQQFPPQTFGFSGYAPQQQGFGYAPQRGFAAFQSPPRGFTPPQQNVGTYSGSSQHDTETVQETQFEEPEEVEETETPQSAKKGKRAKVMWSDEETKILAECWARASLDCIVGNSQSSGNFWNTVRTEYNSLVSEPRRQDQLTGKWSKMNKDVKAFIAIYEKLESIWQSGASDKDIIKQAKKTFHLQNGRAFIYEDAWEVLKDCPQFLTYDGFNHKRREPEPINLEDPEPTPVPNTNAPNLDHLFRQDPIRRPRGRDSSKSARNSCSSDAASRLSSEEARQRVVESADATKDAMLEIRRESQMRTKFETLKLLSQPVSSDIPQEQYDLVMAYRNKLAKKLSKQMKEFSSDDEDEE